MEEMGFRGSCHKDIISFSHGNNISPLVNILVLRIRDVSPGSGYFFIPDSGSQIQILHKRGGQNKPTIFM
jgi:hypothetical protein